MDNTVEEVFHLPVALHLDDVDRYTAEEFERHIDYSLAAALEELRKVAKSWAMEAWENRPAKGKE